ncbi:uncharacterized protein BYT42DRAFT_556791, partial [Radiomyces spectabilis]|uniref:uncharacterized protein n=1 Tax=Radiomyces spectabilis TaxID=64574 RepID=UPI00221FEE8F
MNSASAILTNNNDRYFVPFKPDGSRSMHFRLAFEPGDLTDTIQEYRQWEKALVQDEWPYYFGAKRSHEEQVVALELAALPVKDSPHHTVYMTEFDEFMANRRRQTQNEAKKENYPHSHHHQEKRKKSTKAWIPKLREHDIPLDQLDLANVPKSWKDIIRVDESRIRHGGKGVFATRRLPAHTPLGFYFGVPMTEDEFDSMKEDVGRASEYSMMYRKTVLDATNAEGQPYTDPNGDIFCPFHFINGASETEPNVAFTEGTIANQMVCWTKKEIRAGEELL